MEMSYVLNMLLMTSLSNSNLQSRGKCAIFFFTDITMGRLAVLKPPPVLTHLALVALPSALGCVPFWNGSTPGCDAHVASRGCSTENTIGNHVKMCFLEEFPMLSTQKFLDRLDISEGITFLAGFQWTQIQTETGRTKNGSKQSLVVMHLCLKVDGLLNWFIFKIVQCFLFHL